MAITKFIAPDGVRIGNLTILPSGDLNTFANIAINGVNITSGGGGPVSSDTLTGTTLATNILSSSLTSVGVLDNLIANDVTIVGNLTVQGTKTSLNAATLDVSDLNITVAKGSTSSASSNGAGLTVDGPALAATLLYASSDDSWNVNKKFKAPEFNGELLGNVMGSSSSLTYPRVLTISGDANWDITFDGTKDVAGNIVLATVNSSVGSFGNATTSPVVTVNSKGLVTSITEAEILATGTIDISSTVFSNTLLASASTTHYVTTTTKDSMLLKLNIELVTAGIIDLAVTVDSKVQLSFSSIETSTVSKIPIFVDDFGVVGVVISNGSLSDSVQYNVTLVWGEYR